MNYKQFLKASNDLKKFIKEQEKLDNVLKVISPTSTAVVEFGNTFIDNYIEVVEIALKDDSGWFSWFVFENNFGANKLKVQNGEIKYSISNEKDFFEYCLNGRNL